MLVLLYIDCVSNAFSGRAYLMLMQVVFLSFCEFRWNSYLLWSWRVSVMLVLLYIDCVSNAFSGRAYLMSMQVISFLRVCLQVSPWQGISLEMKGKSCCCVWGGTASLFSGCHHPIRGWVWSPVAGTEALRVRLKLALFPLSVCFPLSPHKDPCSREGECWSKAIPCGLSAPFSSRQISEPSLNFDTLLCRFQQLFPSLHSDHFSFLPTGLCVDLSYNPCCTVFILPVSS